MSCIFFLLAVVMYLHCSHTSLNLIECTTNLHTLRYKKEWIYDYLLLKIKSTAVYTFLHENEYLPLPNPRTLCMHLRSLKADFGFDSTLYNSLFSKTSCKYFLRESVEVWNNTQTYYCIL